MTSRYVDSLFRAVTSSANKLDLHSVLSVLTSATIGASAAPIDHLYTRIGALKGPYFPAGWGNLSVVNYEEDLRHLIQGPPSSIKLTWRLIERGSRDGTEYLLYEGTFRTPCLQRVFDALPPESRTGRVQLLMPARLRPFRPGSETAPSGGTPLGAATAAAGPGGLPYPHGESRRPEGANTAVATGTVPDGPACVVHLAATGDQTFGRRLKLGFPLLKDDVCTMVLESPFYGARRPAGQRGSKLLRVSDLLTLGWATISESLNLLHWLREEGYGPLGMCGLSMGGVHACMTAGLYPGDVAITPLLAPRSAAVAYCDGAMRAAMAWEPLLKEVDENNNHITQVVLAAGRAITVTLPGRGADPDATGTAAEQSVALMREATYALADLELRGEKHHLAEAEAAVVQPPLQTTSNTAVSCSVDLGGASISGGGVGIGLGANESGVGSSNGGEGGGGGSGVSGFFRGLPSVSVMDLYGNLAGLALRAGLGGASSGNGGSAPRCSPPGADSNVPRQPHTGEQAAASPVCSQASGPAAGASTSTGGPMGHASAGAGVSAFNGRALAAASAEEEERGPFSGILNIPQAPAAADGGGLGPAAASALAGTRHCASPARRHAEAPHHRTEAPPPLGDPRVARPHPQPRTQDMPFAPQGSPSVAPAESAGVAGAKGARASGDGGRHDDDGGPLLGRRLLGDLGRAVKQLRANDRRMDSPATVARLKTVLETYTDVTRYPRPRRTDAAVIVAARDDAYVSTESVRQLHRYWPGSELRMVSGGHVSAFLMHQEAFRGAIRDSLARLTKQQQPLPPQ